MPGTALRTDRPPRAFHSELATGNGGLAELRRSFEQWLTRHAVEPVHSADLVVVLSELAANAIAAEGDEERAIAVRAWCADGEVVLEVENAAQDHVGGVVRPTDPDPLRRSGRGMLIAAAYTDIIEVLPPRAGRGMVVRCHKRV